jgi:D-alanyl-D-alanine dipeptidase
VFLLFGLVRPWGQVFPRWTLALRGRRVPRWLPLTPALIGAATLAPYGLIGVCYAVLGTVGVVTVQRGDFPSPADALLVTWIGLAAFAVYGVALLLAARSYWLRTRLKPGCGHASQEDVRRAADLRNSRRRKSVSA